MIVVSIAGLCFVTAIQISGAVMILIDRLANFVLPDYVVDEIDGLIAGRCHGYPWTWGVGQLDGLDGHVLRTAFRISDTCPEWDHECALAEMPEQRQEESWSVTEVPANLPNTGDARMPTF